MSIYTNPQYCHVTTLRPAAPRCGGAERCDDDNCAHPAPDEAGATYEAGANYPNFLSELTTLTWGTSAGTGSIFVTTYYSAYTG
jgi:hypothetical protein